MTVDQDELKSELKKESAVENDPADSTKPSLVGRLLRAGVILCGLFVVLCVGVYFAQLWWKHNTVVEGSDVKGPEVNITDDNGDDVKQPVDDRHPVEPALDIARDGLAHSQKNIKDYTTIASMKQLVNGKLVEDTMFLKIRNRKVDEDGKVVVPFGVYMKFLKPKEKAGREVIWVEGANNGKLIAHETGLLNLFKIPLDPEGRIAMAGQRYPIWEIGLEKLIEQLIVRGSEELKHEQCDVDFLKGEVDGHTCTIIELVHPDKKPEYAFHKAQVFIDDQRQIPLRYICQMWPEKEGDEAPIDEEYNYQDVKVNVGLTDADFDPDNPDYDYP